MSHAAASGCPHCHATLTVISSRMVLPVWQFATVMLMALAMTAAVAHLMELPPKMKFEPRLYVMLHRTLYPNFGRIAGIAEILALVAVIGLAWRVREQGAIFGLTLVSAILMTAAHAVFWALVQPANTTMAAWPLGAIPAHWTQWRN
jgi:uncharacterized membrane protein YesL